MLLSIPEYQYILSELVQAHKDLNEYWFRANKEQCKKLICHWTTLYIYTRKDKYSKAARKLEHILKMCTRYSKWKQYKRELGIISQPF